MKNITISFNQEKCTSCGLCINECPIDILELKNNYPSYKSDKEKDCIECGHCFAVCKDEAVNLKLSDNIDKNIKETRDIDLSYDDLNILLNGRRSIRCYQNKAVEKSKIESLINIASKAPTAKNSQMVEWIVYNSKDEVKNIAGMIVDVFKNMIKNNHPITNIYPLERLTSSWDKGYDKILRNAPSLLLAHTNSAYGVGIVDSVIALTYIDIASKAFSLGTCWAGILMIALSHSEDLARKLKIPEQNVLRGALMLGYPENKYYKIPPRQKAKILWA